MRETRHFCHTCIGKQYNSIRISYNYVIRSAFNRELEFS